MFLILNLTLKFEAILPIVHGLLHSKSERERSKGGGASGIVNQGLSGSSCHVTTAWIISILHSIRIHSNVTVTVRYVQMVPVLMVAVVRTDGSLVVAVAMIIAVY